MAANKALLPKDTGIGRSPSIWRRFPWEQIKEDNNLGDMVYENYLGLAFTAAASNLAYPPGGWQAWIPTGGNFTGLATEEPTGPGSSTVAFGVARTSEGTTTHNSFLLQLGKASGSFGLSSTASSLPKLFFECRVRFNVAGAAATAAYFFGLATNGLATANNTIFSTADALVTSSQYYLGFTSINAATIKPMYAANAAATNPGSSGAIPTTLTNWTKLGFFVDPLDYSVGNGLLQFYQDGTLLYSGAIPTSNFPTAVPLTPSICVQLGGSSTTDVNLDIDWIAAGQYITVE